MDTQHRDTAADRALAAVGATHPTRTLSGGELRTELLLRGYDIVPTPAEDEPLHGDPAAHDPQELLERFVEWLDGKRQLVEIPPDVAGDLNDLVLHFLADRREARTLGNKD